MTIRIVTERQAILERLWMRNSIRVQMGLPLLDVRRLCLWNIGQMRYPGKRKTLQPFLTNDPSPQHKYLCQPEDRCRDKDETERTRR